MIKQIKSLVQFSRGTSLVWGSMSTAVPDGVVVFSIDDGAFRLGDGVTMFSALPVLFTFADLVSAQGGVSGLFAEPVVADNGKIVVVSFDAGSNTTSYAISDTSLTGLLADLATLEADNAAQDVAIANILATSLSIDTSINTGANNNVIVINDRRYSNSGQSLATIQASIDAGATFVPGCHLDESVIYADSEKRNVVDKMKLMDGGAYYVDVVGFNSSGGSAVFGLTSTNTGVTITPVSGSLFKVTFDSLTGGVKDDTPAILMASIDDGTGNATVKKAISVLVQRQRIMISVYGGSLVDYFRGVTTDSQGNIICAGYTTSEGAGGDEALVVKFDSSLNVLAKKRYGGTNTDAFLGVTTDGLDNIICAGYTASETGGNDALVVKFDSLLNIVARKRYGGSGADYFYGVATDSQNNIICAGYTTSEGTNADALAIKFDSLLNIVARKRYGGSGGDYFYAVTTDSQNNIICAGYTTSEGVSNDGLVVKFDSSLNIVARKTYGGAGVDYFYGVATDSQDNIICAGYTGSEGDGSYDALVVKFDSLLNIVARKRYGGTGGDIFHAVATDSQDNIICAGYTGSEGVSTDAFVVKFDNSLNILARKHCGGSNNDYFKGVTLDNRNNIICVGETRSEGIGDYDALILKLPTAIPSGTIVGTILTNITLADSFLTLADSTLTLADSNLTLANSTLTLADSTLTLADSTLTLETDILN